MDTNFETNWKFDLSKLTVEHYIETMSDSGKLFWYRIINKWIMENEDHELLDVYEILVSECERRGLI